MFYKANLLSPWTLLSLLIFCIFASPILIVLASLFGEYSDNWIHLYKYVLGGYVYNSFLLIIGVSTISLFLGIGTAWLTSNYNFFGKNFFDWALILPLAVPPYILAYTFTGLFDSYGTANNLIREIFSLNSEYIFFPNVRNIYGAIIVFSFTLYPYIYLATRIAFINQSRSLREVGETLGFSKFGVFFKLVLPMIRPAIIGGLMLVIMETLSDFGAVEHFAIQTFTTGIFRTWYGMYDLQTAMQLSSLLLIFITFFLVLERYSRNNISYTSGSPTYGKIENKTLTGRKNILSFLFCLTPLSIGFILPISELTNWALNYKLDFFEANFIKNSFNTIYLALLAAIFCTFVALIINFSGRIQKTKFFGFLSSALALGYALPGIILAIGIMQLFIFLDNNLSLLNIFFTGSILCIFDDYVNKD